MKKRISLSLLFLLTGVVTYFLFDIDLINKSNFIFKILRNYFSDMCWAFSFFFMSIIFTSNITKKSLLINSVYVLTIAIIFELLQYFKYVKGTFDVIDVFVYIVSTIIACLIEKKLRRKENEEI